MRKHFFTILALALTACQSQRPHPPINTGQEGTPIAAINLRLPDSITTLSTKNIPNGKPVVLIFFSPYCPFCRAEISDVIKNINSLSGARVYMVTNFPLKRLKSFDSAYQLNRYANIVTAQDYANVFMTYYKTPGIPLTAIFDKQKNLKEAFVGRMTADQIGHAAGLN